jgi:hypothetical protein
MLSGIISKSVVVHIYAPQYLASTLVRNSIPLTALPKILTFWLERLADKAVVDQSTVTVSGLLEMTVHCIVAFW